jgi:tRNA (cmo5U34)-methyltransferase
MEPPFSNPDVVSEYAERTGRLVSSLGDMHRMTGLLLAEPVPPGGRVLVIGAGGGLDLRALAEMRPGWRLHGVDPSLESLGRPAPRSAL